MGVEGDRVIVGVAGGGSWGSALAKALLRNSVPKEVIVFSRQEESVHGCNYLVTNDISELKVCQIILMATPAQATRSICQKLAGFNGLIVICSKGIEVRTLSLLSEVVASVIPLATTAILSGPSFASEVEKELPCAVNIATSSLQDFLAIDKILSSQNFQLSFTPDVIGVQLAGAIKNVIAIAVGMSRGKVGNNAAAIILLRGVQDMKNIIKAKGGSLETIESLAGLGDLFLTASSLESRNTAFGFRIGKGEEPRLHHTVEGAETAIALYDMARDLGIEVPVCKLVYQVLKQKRSVEEALSEVLGLELIKA